MKLEQAMQDVASKYEYVGGTPSYKCQTGEEYVAVVSGGIKPEGDRFPVYCSTPEQAVLLWMLAFVGYSATRPQKGKLYWREKPTVEGEVLVSGNVPGNWPKDKDGFPMGLAHKFYTVYSRLVISDREEVES